MKIGFDAKWFFTGTPSGRVIVTNILKYLIKQNPQHDFYIFLKRKDKYRNFPYISSNVKLLYIGGKINLFTNIFLIPLYSLFLDLDVCVFQNNSPLISTFKRIAFIYDVIFMTNPQFFSIWERIYFFPLKFLARKAHKVCTISESERKRISQFKFSKYENIDVIHLGVNEKYRPIQDLNRDIVKEVKMKYNLPEKYILYVGRLNERKNIFNLLKAFSFLNNKDVKLVLGGSQDWKMFNVSKAVHDLRISDDVIITGYIADEHMPPLYSLATLFCYISYDEGFGLPPIEAMASGIPIIVAKTGSLPEICASAGNYVNPHSPEEIANTIQLLLKDNTLYQDKKVAGLERAKYFCWEKAALSMMDSIEQTVKQKYSIDR